MSLDKVNLDENGNPTDVDECGRVKDRYDVETYYLPAESWSRDPNETYVRLVIDDDATNIETRLTLPMLEEMVAALRHDAPSPQPECEVTEQEIRDATDWIAYDIEKYRMPDPPQLATGCRPCDHAWRCASAQADVRCRDFAPAAAFDKPLAAPPQESDKRQDEEVRAEAAAMSPSRREEWIVSLHRIRRRDADRIAALESQLAEARAALASRPIPTDVSPDRSGEAGKAASLRADAIRSKEMRGEPITDAERCVLAWDTSSATDRASFERGWEAQKATTEGVMTVPREEWEELLGIESCVRAFLDTEDSILISTEERNRLKRLDALRSSAQAGEEAAP